MHVDLAKNPIIIDHLPVTICNFSTAASQDLVARIGYVPGLSDTETEAPRPRPTQSMRAESEDADPRRRMSVRRSQSYAGSAAGTNFSDVRIASGPSTPVGRAHGMDSQYPFAPGSGSNSPRNSSPRRPPQRNDTVYTTASSNTTISGPGMAGRGATGAGGGNSGQFFSWGQYGAAQPYSSEPEYQPPPVRSAFAGPASIYNGNDGTGLSSLSREENRALAHHSARPQSLAMLGGYDPMTGSGYSDNRTTSFQPGQIVGASPSRPANFGTIQEGIQGFNPISGQIGGPQFRERTYSTPSSQHSAPRPSSSPNFLAANSLSPNFDPSQLNNSTTSLNSPSTPNSTNLSTTPTTPTAPLGSAAAAEAEKMRLYERARQQAERNQRRADEKRAKAAGGTLTGTLSSVRSVSSPAEETGAARTPTLSSTISSHENAEAEKTRLYERARKQAEKYQAGYKQGASFPSDEAEPPSSSGRVSEGYSDPNSEEPRPPFDKRSSANFWMTGNSNSQNQSASAATSTSSSIAPAPAPSQFGSAASTSRNSLPPTAYPSAEEEKRRLYEAAKAQTEAHLRQESGDVGGSFSSMSIASPPTSAAVPGSGSRPMSQAVGAGDEKAQMKRFYEAQDAVAKHHRGESSSGMAGGSSSSAPYETVPVPSYDVATNSRLSVLDGTSSGTSTPPAQQLPEKEQLRLYHAARDAQQISENQAMEATGSGSAAMSSSSQPLLARPAPSYAANYSKNGTRSTSAPQSQDPNTPINQTVKQPPSPNPSPNQPQSRRTASITGGPRPLPSTSPPPSTKDGNFGAGSSTLPPSFGSSFSNSAPSPALIEIGEKAQMKAYYEARDAADENARLQGHSTFASSADIYTSSNAITSSTNGQNQPPILPPLTFSNSTVPPSTSPMPSTKAFPPPISTSPSFAQSPPPIPPQNFYAPRRAKSSWEELEGDEEQDRLESSNQKGSSFKPPPPPLPPKTPVMR